MMNVRRGEWTIGALLLVMQQELHDLATDLEEATFAGTSAQHPRFVFTTYLQSMPALVAALRDASEKAGAAWADIHSDRAHGKTVQLGRPAERETAAPSRKGRQRR